MSVRTLSSFLASRTMYIKIMLRVFLHLLGWSSVCTKNQQTFRRILGNNEIAGNDVIMDIKGTGSVFQCIGNCKSDTQCWSIGYKNDGDICRLVSTILDESNVKGADLGWTYFVMTGDLDISKDVSRWAFKPSVSVNWTEYRDNILTNPIGTCANQNVGPQQSCYYFGDSVMRSFNESQTICNNRGGYMVNIDSSEENDFILNIVSKRDKETWIGCSDELEEGTWVWLPSKTPLTYSDWRPGQPDNKNNQNCVIFHKATDTSFHWHDCSCDRKSSLMCEKSNF